MFRYFINTQYYKLFYILIIILFYTTSSYRTNANAVAPATITPPSTEKTTTTTNTIFVHTNNNNYVPIFLNENNSINFNVDVQKYKNNDQHQSSSQILLNANMKNNMQQLEHQFQQKQKQIISVPSSSASSSSSSAASLMLQLNDGTGPGPGPGFGPLPKHIILELANNLEMKLKNIRNLELGFPIVQELFDSMDFKTIIRNDTKTIDEIVDKLTKKLLNSEILIETIINKFNEKIDNPKIQSMIINGKNWKNKDQNLLYEQNLQLNTIVHPCSSVLNQDSSILDSSSMDPTSSSSSSSASSSSISNIVAGTGTILDGNYDKSQIEIINYFKNVNQLQMMYNNNNDLNYTINLDLMNAIKSINYTKSSNVKQIYFLSKDDDIDCEHCNNINYGHMRYIYSSTMKNIKKRILLLIDHGSSLNVDQLELTKSFASDIVNMLNKNDQIIVVGVSDKLQTFIDTSMNAATNDKHEHSAASSSMIINQSVIWHNVTMDIKMKLLQFIDSLNKTKEITNHSLGFHHAFELLQNYFNMSTDDTDDDDDGDGDGDLSNVPVLMLYISRGLLSPLSEAKSVLEAIAQGQRLLRKPVIINTCAIILDEKRVMYEKQFLKDVAVQNYTKYNINATDWQNQIGYSLIGKMYTVYKNYPDELIKTSTSIFNYWFHESLTEQNYIAHLPIVDDTSRDMIVSITKSFKNYGIIGLDLYLSDISEDIIYYNKQDDSYSFMIDLNGNTLMHPSYPRPIAMSQQEPFYATDIKYLEIYSDFDGVRRRMLDERSGNATISANNIRPNNTITFTWKRSLELYIICIATFRNNNTKIPMHLRSVNVNLHYYHFNENFNVNTLPDLLFHRIDLIPPKTNVCRHFKQIATLESGTLYLSSSSFKSPFNYLKNNRDGTDELRIHYAKSVMAYLKDTTHLLTNPGLMGQIRSDVAALFHVMTFLRKRHAEGGILSKYIIRRYVATVNGVIQVYPGCMIGSDMEPTRRPWFIKAMENPGKIVLTEPYLDAGGAGYIVTISQTIFEGRSNALHSAERDIPVAIVSIDLTHGFFYKLLLQSADFCSDTNIKCFLMEDKGYLVAHPSILEPLTNTMKNYRRPLEHITHKESYVANDILYHKRFVQKRFCRNYLNRTNQRFYQFNTSYMDVLTNSMHSERTKYQVTIIPGTNIFVGLLNTTGDGGAFCPCSTVDRICLNCNLMEQTNCECPCECPLDIYKKESKNPKLSLTWATKKRRCNDLNADKNRTMNIDGDGNDDDVDRLINMGIDCENDRLLLNVSNEICLPQPEQLSTINSLSYDLEMDIKSCFHINCELYGSQTDCLGIMGCEWCQVDMDGETIFSVPFCTNQISCFNGILGSITPYGDGDLSASMVDTIVPPAYSAIGPVAGAVIALCLVIGFAMYCYRQNLDSGTEHLYAESIPENNYGVPLSRFDYDDMCGSHNDHDTGGGGGGGGQGGFGGAQNGMNHNLLGALNNPIHVQEISPYRVNGNNYRRPAGESDHGYSTMTPHEDSEHMCFALAEPLINNNPNLNNGGGGGGAGTSAGADVDNVGDSSNNSTAKRLSMSDSISIHTSVSSPTNHNHLIQFDATTPPCQLKHNQNYYNNPHRNPQQQQQQYSSYDNNKNDIVQMTNVLPQTSPHHIQAPVTVHRSMEAS